MQPISETRAVIMSVRCQDRGHGRPGAGIGEQGMPFDATGFRDEGGDEPEEWHLPPRVLVALCVWMAVLWVVLAVFVRTGVAV